MNARRTEAWPQQRAAIQGISTAKIPPRGRIIRRGEGSGEWRVASGEWREASGEWRAASGEGRETRGEGQETRGLLVGVFRCLHSFGQPTTHAAGQLSGQIDGYTQRLSGVTV
jgi:hypothetical protein